MPRMSEQGISRLDPRECRVYGLFDRLRIGLLEFLDLSFMELRDIRDLLVILLLERIELSEESRQFVIRHFQKVEVMRSLQGATKRQHCKGYYERPEMFNWHARFPSSPNAPAQAQAAKRPVALEPLVGRSPEDK